jgi:hypothetical protein
MSHQMPDLTCLNQHLHLITIVVAEEISLLLMIHTGALQDLVIYFRLEQSFMFQR